MTKSKINTLKYDPSLCNNCGMCAIVCPHRVFTNGDTAARLVDRDSCMECGACALNCQAEAINVESSVGCAYAMMRGALLRKAEPDCGCS